MEFLEGGLLNGALRTITNIDDKEYLYRYLSRTLFMDSGMTSFLKNGFRQRHFVRSLLPDFRIVTYLKTGSSERYFWRILFIDFKTSATKVIQLKVKWRKILKSFCSNISRLLPFGNSYIYILNYFYFFVAYSMHPYIYPRFIT